MTTIYRKLQVPKQKKIWATTVRSFRYKLCFKEKFEISQICHVARYFPRWIEELQNGTCELFLPFLEQ